MSELFREDVEDSVAKLSKKIKKVEGNLAAYVKKWEEHVMELVKEKEMLNVLAGKCEVRQPELEEVRG